MNSTRRQPDTGGSDASALPASAMGGAEGWVIEPWLTDLVLLTKARANVAVVATTLIGFGLHADISANPRVALCTVVGTALLAGGASIANQSIEHRFDRNMARTRNRPIAAGRLRPRAGFALSALFAVTGSLFLLRGVNLHAWIHGLLAFLIYVGIYTPMKRLSPACTVAGSVSGALPLWVGWAATDTPFDLWTVVTFAVLYLWQIPHFMAIAWWRKTDYLGAGYRVLPANDPEGFRTAGFALAFAVGMVMVSLIPALAQLVTGWYLPAGLVLGAAFIASAVRFRMMRTEAAARALFLASIFYLPAIFAAMLLCQWRN